MNRLLAAAVFAFLLSSCDNGPHELILARPDTRIDQEIAANLIELLGDDAAVRIRLSADAMSGGEALLAVANGAVDIALISNDQPYRDDVATVMPLYATVLHIVHRSGSPLQDPKDLLQGAKVFAGSEGSASRRVFERLTANLDLGDTPYTYVDDRIEDADVAVVFAPLAPERLAAFDKELTLWSMGTPADLGNGGPIDGIVLLNPHFRPFIIPAGTYGAATPGPVVTIAVDKIFVTQKNLSRSVVYDLINEVLRVRPALASTFPGLIREMTGDFDTGRSRFVLHQGAQDYLQRSEPTFVERYSGVAEVLVTLMIASVSATFAGVRVFNRRRKNRIDRFYSAAISIRNEIAGVHDSELLMHAAGRLGALQDEAFELLVDEKLAADESFQIFVTLCNDVLGQIDARMTQS